MGLAIRQRLQPAEHPTAPPHQSLDAGHAHQGGHGVAQNDVAWLGTKPGGHHVSMLKPWLIGAAAGALRLKPPPGQRFGIG